MMGKLISLNQIPIVSLSLFIILFLNVFTYADICTYVNCGQGVCSATALLAFDCRCNPGWTKPKIGEIILPFCMLPNCTIDFNCGLSPAPVTPLISPVAPPISPVAPLQLLDIFEPCGLVWCGEGNCVVNESGYSCQCDEGSVNLMRSSTLPCLRKCSIGADCNGLHFELPPFFPP